MLLQSNTEPAKSYTLDQFIEMQATDDLTYYNFSIIEVMNGVQHLNHNLIEDYLPEILDICSTITLSTDEFRKYKYSPDLLAYDVYGSTQLDVVIMLLNDVFDPKEFDKQTLNLPYSSGLATILNSIYSKEYNYIANNRKSQGLVMR